MNARTAAVVLPVLITLGLGAAIGGLVVVQNQRQADQVAKAEELGQEYLSDAATFRLQIAKRIKAADTSKLDAVRRVVDASIKSPPKLPSASEFGRENSQAYREAVDVQSTLLGPYERLSTILKEAEVARVFIAAAREVLELRATDFVGFGLITSSGPVRSSLIPAFANARDEFDAVQVPNGQKELASTVHDAAQYVINQATTLADKIEARQSFSFTYSEQFQAAADAINDYATTVEGDVTEAVNAAINVS